MKICLIAEGSYPYVTGGVSSWIQSLVTKMPEHQFIIYCISAEEKIKGKFNYKIPQNVIEVKEIFLDGILNEKGEFGVEYAIAEEQILNIKNLIIGESVDFSELFKFIQSKKMRNVTDFFMSKNFFDIVMETYEIKYSYMPFTEFFWAIRSMLLPLFYVIKQEIPEADLYHSVSTGYAGVFASLSQYVTKKPFILTEHGIYSREREEDIIKSKFFKSYFKDMWIQFFYNISKCGYEFSTEVVTLFSKNKLIESELGCDERKISIIPNGVDIKNYKNMKLRDDDVVVNVGSVLRVVSTKDVKTMIESFAIVSREVPNCNYYIIGPTDEDEEYYDECIQLVESLNLKNVIFTGRVNVKDYLDKIDIMVLSSISEGQPLAILEGMAAKKPFVTTDVGACSELIYGNNDEFGTAGIVVPVMNYMAMGRAIIKLVKNKKLRQNMGENGFARISKYYTQDKFIQSYKNIYAKYEV